MSINFEDDINPAAFQMLKEMSDVEAADLKTALLNRVDLNSRKLKDLANTAKQPVTVEINEIGDWKEVGGLVYELREAGWYRLPIGTRIEDKDDE